MSRPGLPAPRRRINAVGGLEGGYPPGGWAPLPPTTDESGEFRLEARPDGSVLVTARQGAPPALGLVGLAAGVGLLGAVIAGGVTLVGAVLALPAGVILLLAGWGALRHRDWVLVDRAGRQVLHRRGLGAMFRAIPALAFDEVVAIRLEAPGPGRQAVSLVGLDGTPRFLWEVGEPAAAALVAAVEAATGWPVERPGVRDLAGKGP